MNTTDTDPPIENSTGSAAAAVAAEAPSSRLESARALDVVQRTVRFGLGCEQDVRRPRYLNATCRPWLERLDPSSLHEPEREALTSLVDILAEARDAGSSPAPLELLHRLEHQLAPFEELLALTREAELTEPRVRLLPEGELARSKAMRERQEAEAARRKAQKALPPEPVTTDEPAAPAKREPRELREEPPSKRGSGKREGRGAGAKQPSRQPRSSDEGEERASELEAATPAQAEPPPRSERPEPEPEPEPEPVPEPPPPPRPLNHPEGAGIRLADFVSPRQRLLAEALEGHGIETVADLLLQPPSRYELLPRAVAPSELTGSGQKQVLRGQVVRRLTRIAPLGRRHEVLVSDGQAAITCRWITPRDEAFWAGMPPGQRVALHGLVEAEGDTTLLVEAEPVWVDSRGQGRQACYELEGVSELELRALISQALGAFEGRLLDPLPEGMRKRLRLLNLEDALRRLHFPTHGASRGQERMAFDELLLYQLGHRLGQKRKPRERGFAHPVQHRLVSQIMASRTKPLSDGQEIAFSEIRRDLVKARPMNRLLQGEVGVGKGFVALLSAIIVAEGRSQVIFIAPDALAAEHRYLFAEPLLRSVGLVPTLVLGKPDGPQADALRRGEIHVAFATPAVTRAWPGFRKLGLVIVEEREAYGTVALANLPSQGTRPDLLVLTDAPIPTSIALTVFGHMDLSLVPGQLVPGLEVTSHPWSEHMEAYRRARDELEAGRQIYVVLPMIGGRERLEQRELARFADALRGDAFPGARIGLFTGKMSREERHRTYQDFLHRRIDVLLTTTIIEDGPSVSNATTTVVLEADRFDLVRLHRLRAHVSRGVRAGRCLFVLSEQPDAEGVKLVELMVREHDAFRIAELDLAARGAEALLGDRASELPSFRYMDPLEHRDLLVRARTEAFGLLDEQGRLQQSAYQGLRTALEESWQRWFPEQPIPQKKKSGGRRRSGRRRRRRPKK